MRSTRARHLRCAAAFAALCVGALGLPVPPAQAAPVFTAHLMALSSAFSDSLVQCTLNNDDGEPLTVDLVDNGPSATLAGYNRGTLTKVGDASDVLSFRTRMTGTARVASESGNPRTIDLDAVGTVSATTTKPTSECRVRATSVSRVETGFTVAQAGFLTIRTQGSDHSTGSVYLREAGQGQNYFEAFGQGTGFDSVHSVFLPAGSYEASVSATAFVYRSTGLELTPVRVGVHATFDVAGSRTDSVRGRGSRFVSLSATRACQNASLTAQITSHHKRAKKIRKVRVLVNDQLVKKARTPRAGQVIHVPVASKSAADVRILVKLAPSHPGRPGKSYSATTRYAPCA